MCQRRRGTTFSHLRNVLEIQTNSLIRVWPRLPLLLLLLLHARLLEFRLNYVHRVSEPLIRNKIPIRAAQSYKGERASEHARVRPVNYEGHTHNFFSCLLGKREFIFPLARTVAISLAIFTLGRKVTAPQSTSTLFSAQIDICL